MKAAKALRVWRGTRSQTEAAKELGINQSTLARLESGGTPRAPLANLVARKTDGAVPVEAWGEPADESSIVDADRTG